MGAPKPTVESSMESGNPRAPIMRKKMDYGASIFHSMPTIPEELEMSEVGLSGAQKAMELLNFALSEDADYVSVMSDDDEVNSNEIELGRSSGSGPMTSRHGFINLEATIVEAGQETGTIPQESCDVRFHSIHIGTDAAGLFGGGKTSKSKLAKLEKGSAYILFGLINFGIIATIAASAMAVGGLTPAVTITASFGLVWLALFIFNMSTAIQPELVVDQYWKAKKNKLLPLKDGKVVVVKGRVSQLDDPLISEFRKSGEYLLVDTRLKSIVSRHPEYCVYKEHVRQTKAVDFTITDSTTGVNLVVEATSAAKNGLLSPYVEPRVSVDFRMGPELLPLLGSSQDVRRKALETSQYKVHEGYISNGQMVTIMGRLKRCTNGEYVLVPFRRPHNVSWFLLFYKVVPFFCPVWVSGLVILDQ